jgi:modulator of FtsH protease HflK
MNGTDDQSKTPSTGAPVPETPDDAGSRALADALSSSFAIIRVIMVVLVLLFLFSGFFTVGTQEKAVILRFGKPAGAGENALLGPGPHWAFPAPIDEVVRIPVGQIQRVDSTVGWYATSAAREATGDLPPPAAGLDPNTEGYLLTGDENIVHVRGSLLYRINEPGLNYAFNFAASSNLVQNTFNNALLYAAAGFKVDDLLTRDVAGYRDRVRTRLSDLIVQYKLGITIDAINIEKTPPRKLQKAFDAVVEADQRRGKILNEARSYENQTISRARAEAEQRRNAGERDRNALVKAVQAEAATFQGLLPQYKANPELFIQQRQTEVLQRVLTNAEYRVVLPRRNDGKPREVRIQVSPGQPPVVKPVEAPPTEDEHG